MNQDNFESLKRGMAEVEAFLAGDQTAGVVHTPEQITARRKPGRPAGTVKANRKEQVALRLDPEVLAYFRATGPGWQSRINDVLRGIIAA